MNVIESIFREYDIRGTYPSEINEDVISIIGQAIALKCKEEGVTQISVGRDGRLSGETLLNSMCNSLAKSGISVTNIGLVTSPILYYAAKKNDSKSGIMITGSHNPKDDNGIKMVINNKPVSGTEILSLTKATLSFNEIKEDIIKLDIIENYIDDVMSKITLDKPGNLKIVIDCGNGAAGCVAPELFKRLGCNVINLFSEIDGNFPNHHPDPGKLENLKDLIESVKKENADLGLAFDGDGDRVVYAPCGCPAGAVPQWLPCYQLYVDGTCAAESGGRLLGSPSAARHCSAATDHERSSCNQTLCSPGRPRASSRCERRFASAR